MAIKFESIQVGEVLLDVHSENMGNTYMRQMGVWTVRVISLTDSGAMVSWNGNREERYPRHFLERLRRFAPEWIKRTLPNDSGRNYFCYHCRADSAVKDTAKHKLTCPHPKAVAFRKKQAAKAKTMKKHTRKKK